MQVLHLSLHADSKIIRGFLGLAVFRLKREVQVSDLIIEVHDESLLAFLESAVDLERFHKTCNLIPEIFILTFQLEGESRMAALQVSNNERVLRVKLSDHCVEASDLDVEFLDIGIALSSHLHGGRFLSLNLHILGGNGSLEGCRLLLHLNLNRFVESLDLHA